MSYIKNHSSPCKLVEIAKEQVLCLKVMVFFEVAAQLCSICGPLFVVNAFLASVLVNWATGNYFHFCGVVFFFLYLVKKCVCFLPSNLVFLFNFVFALKSHSVAIT